MPIPDHTQTPLDKLVRLNNRCAVITGGARGIGLAIASRLKEAGAHIVIADIDEGHCISKALAKLDFNGCQALALNLDTRKMSDMRHAAAKAKEHFGRIDIWVNDAGIYPITPFMQIDEREWQNVIETNISGVFHGTRAAVEQMDSEAGGVILNLTSVTGLRGTEGFAHYSASKFAVRGLTATFAKELGERNIRVVAIAPTMIETPGVKDEKAAFDALRHGDVFEQQKKSVPLGRLGQPDDVARVALFLVSDLAAFISGTTVVVDGGKLSLG